MKDDKPDKREESPWVTVARYSGDRLHDPRRRPRRISARPRRRSLSAHPLVHLVGIVLGAIAGFVSMIRRALQSSADEDKKEDDANGGH